MTALELDAYRANVARDVLNINSFTLLDKIKRLIKRETGKCDVEAADGYKPLTHDELAGEFRESLEELKLNSNGKLEFRPAEELLAEL